ncbi:MAG TPA: phosphatidylglycerophosphatase A [Planctomycetota bacterium]|nr:phosphatidylglycerophosphatase A [Planctomycetota bacterium]OQC21735.1 MAG: Phosphatidylglycerophosphatase A [Planctomycetes bacterium ADurb.Bin069]HNR98885.1 phosphatidylglycerophosphatase A [Planctomycetota bacterium]HNU26040.1 phosphatidylglycerophosphatase A [Planctomycetota bacterium]HOE29705.1 phosphatidylglycerophosphatase A [Planctomycetota bacterium]
MTCDAPPAPAPRPRVRGGLLPATGFGIGRLPWWPGTWASLVLCAFAAPALALSLDTAVLRAALAAFACVFSIVTLRWAPGAEQVFGRHDPPAVVSDELAGQSIALLGAAGPLDVLWAFLAFRLFDTLKPWPISRLEKLPGGTGILLDDLAAGVAALLVVLAARLIAGA